MLKILHIVNPVKVGPTSDLFQAQPVTFASMAEARKQSPEDIQIQFQATCYSEDVELVPDFFEITTELKQSVLDLREFKKDRKLPLISDIFNSIPDGGHDYVVYTNVDIALMPWFYTVLSERIRSGLEAFIVNRRTISAEFSSPDELEKMYAQAGKTHPGLDCFVIKSDLLADMDFGKACIGVTFIGKVIEVNMMSATDRFELYKDDHMTFHLGDDRSWKNPDLDDYAHHNKKEFYKVLKRNLQRAESKNRSNAIARIKDHLYKYHDWNEDGANPYLNPPVIQKPPFSERLKRSIGALMGNS